MVTFQSCLLLICTGESPVDSVLHAVNEFWNRRQLRFLCTQNILFKFVILHMFPYAESPLTLMFHAIYIMIFMLFLARKLVISVFYLYDVVSCQIRASCCRWFEVACCISIPLYLFLTDITDIWNQVTVISYDSVIYIKRLKQTPETNPNPCMLFEVSFFFFNYFSVKWK